MTINLPIPNLQPGTRVSFDWFGKRVAGHIVGRDGRMVDVWSGVHRALYSVDMNDLRANPLREEASR